MHLQPSLVSFSFLLMDFYNIFLGLEISFDRLYFFAGIHRALSIKMLLSSQQIHEVGKILEAGAG